MSDHSAIEWTDATWNPTRGCTKISPGCSHCYAETFAERFRGVPNHPYRHGFDIRLVPEKLSEPLRWSHPRTVFVNSMSDLFHEAIPNEYIAAIVNVMRATPWHTYQVLTKRATRLAELLSGSLRAAATLQNVWWGVSVEDREYGVPRITQLQAAPVQLRFLSVEPLLEDVGELPLDGIHWVIVGGESGHGARRMDEAWAISVLRQCEARGVPFFFKQWGGVMKKRNGRTLLNRIWDEMPAVSIAPIPHQNDRKALQLRFEHDAAVFSSEPISLISLIRHRHSARLA
jgi:protein gp37